MGVIVVDRRSDKQWLVSRRIIVIPLKRSITITYCCWTMYKYWTRWEQWPLIGRSSNNCFPSLSAGWLVVCYQSWPLLSDLQHENVFYCLCHDLSLKIKFGEWINGKAGRLHPFLFDRVMHSIKVLLLHKVHARSTWTISGYSRWFLSFLTGDFADFGLEWYWFFRLLLTYGADDGGFLGRCWLCWLLVLMTMAVASCCSFSPLALPTSPPDFF